MKFNLKSQKINFLHQLKANFLKSTASKGKASLKINVFCFSIRGSLKKSSKNKCFIKHQRKQFSPKGLRYRLKLAQKFEVR